MNGTIDRYAYAKVQPGDGGCASFEHWMSSIAASMSAATSIRSVVRCNWRAPDMRASAMTFSMASNPRCA